MIDNIFRFVQAGAEVSGLLGQLPSRVGYQPTLATELAELEERICSTKNGAITSVQAVYVPADDFTDPAAVHTFGHLCAIIFGSERGMCGKFNEKISGFAIDRMNKLAIKPEEMTIFALGDRVIAHLEEAGQTIEERFSMFGSNIGFTLQEVLINIEELRLKKDIDQIVLFYNRPALGTSFRPNMIYLLPFDPEWIRNLSEKKWPSRTLPTFTMDWDSLFSSLTRQYLFFPCTALLSNQLQAKMPAGLHRCR